MRFYPSGKEDGAAERQELVREYMRSGWAVIPLPHGSKNPNRTDWQKERHTVEDVPKLWNNGQNMGVITGEASGWIVDFDLDQPEALLVAPHILPETRTSGRKGKMYSHWWYNAASPLKTREFYIDVPGVEEERPMLEVRANGRQTLLPGSTHPSGEEYVWCNQETIRCLSGEELGSLGEDVASAGLLLRHYPKVGKRHHFVLAATGLLVRHVGPERAERIMQAVVFASGDEEASSRLGDISDTIETFLNDEEITGGPTLEDLLGGPGIVKRLQQWRVVSRDHVRGGARAKDSNTKPTDDELRDRFLEEYPDLAYGLGEWRRYDGGVWPVVKNEVVRRPMVRILEGAKAEGIKPNALLLNSVHELARLECYVEDDRWDSNPNILVAENGAIDISTGDLLPHNPEHYATTCVPYAYNPHAKAPHFTKFVGDIERDVALFLQEYTGYCLTTGTSHEKAVWLIGPPGGGKSTFIEGLIAMLGARHGVLGLAEIERSQFSLAKLEGKTLATAAEQPAEYVKSHHILNAIISGEPIQIERKHKDPYDIVPRAKICWAMNELPRIPSGAEGLFRRVEVVKFEAVEEEKRDPALKEGIKGEGAGVLNWALEGLRRLRDRGKFDVPEKISNTTAQFREHNDVVALFVEERCNRKKGLKIKSSQLYSAYKQWCDMTNHRAKSFSKIAQDWERLGFTKDERKDANYWEGLDLKDFRPCERNLGDWWKGWRVGGRVVEGCFRQEFGFLKPKTRGGGRGGRFFEN